MTENGPDGGLRNTLYSRATQSGRRMTRRRRFVYRLLAPLAEVIIRVGVGLVRVVRVEGLEHLEAALAAAPSFIPCYWHQHLLFCARLLLEQRARGVKLGWLVSPSVDGEIGVMLIQRFGGTVIRGSSTHTGARSLRDYYQALVKDGVSPIITPDGPRGPRNRFKPGAILLSQMSGRPILPMAYAASRALRIQWDRFVIPWPFSRVAIVIGPPRWIPKGLDPAALERLQEEMEAELRRLFEQARTRLNDRLSGTR
jgi:lysophospholipid acyltransferase (LPLAT)-like uncharacterized protein